MENAPVEAVKSENEEKKAVPWFSNAPMSFENYPYSAPFPSPLPSPLDQTQTSLFTSFDGDQPFPAHPPLWYSQMLDGQDMKSFYLMRQGFGNQAPASEALCNSQSMSVSIGGSINGAMSGSGNTGNGSMTPVGGSMNSGNGSISGTINAGHGSMNIRRGSMSSLSGSMNAGYGAMNMRRGSMSSLSGTINAVASGPVSSMNSPSSGLQSPPVTPYLNENVGNLGSLHEQQLRAMMQLRAMGYGLVRPQASSEMDMKKEDMLATPALSPVRNETGMRNLEKEKPFQCTYPGCEARFPRMYNLKSHMLCHTGERPHVCPLECGAKFARKHDLQRHMRTLHSPNRPFQCPYEKCQQAFRRANSFWRHLVEDHPEKSVEHAEIYQRAVQQQKLTQEGKNPAKPPLAIPAPIEIPLSAPSLHAVENMSGQHVDPFFTSVPRLNDSMIYRGHYS